MFKAFIETKPVKPETRQINLDDKFDVEYEVSGLALKVGFVMNGEELLKILPLEAQEYLADLIADCPETREYFSKRNIIYMCAEKISDITGMSDEEKKEEFAEVSEKNFFD